MKLYNEEQIQLAMRLSHSTDLTYLEIIESLEQIKVPTDEEIEAYLKSFKYTKHLDDGQYNDGVIDGAELGIEWVINKIQGGNK